ncbi:A-kinase anchor protein inhibitor 1 isoform X1 [Neopsephotus bourkii]|nr:A-kinase anchor protein inhibitor 1 isoform X1 [Neopsephotus bourkii]
MCYTTEERCRESVFGLVHSASNRQFVVQKAMRDPVAPGYKCEKPGTEQDEVKLQNASKQIVQTAILRAVQQVSQESQQKEKRTNSSTSLQLERGKLTKKHEKK